MLFLVRDRGPVRGGIVRQRGRAVREPVLYHPVYLVPYAVELRVHNRVDEILDVLHRHRRRDLLDIFLNALVADGGVYRQSYIVEIEPAVNVFYIRSVTLSGVRHKVLVSDKPTGLPRLLTDKIIFHTGCVDRVKLLDISLITSANDITHLHILTRLVGIVAEVNNIIFFSWYTSAVNTAIRPILRSIDLSKAFCERDIVNIYCDNPAFVEFQFGILRSPALAVCHIIYVEKICHRPVFLVEIANITV